MIATMHCDIYLPELSKYLSLLCCTLGAAIQYEISAQIFLVAVQSARRHRDFSVLDVEEQNKILCRGWSALFILRAAMWPIDIINIREQSATANNGALAYLTAARTAIAKLQLDDVELCILDTFVLCRPGKYNNYMKQMDY